MTEGHRYAYGVVESEDLELDVSGVEGAKRAYTVTHRSIAAVVSDVDTTEPERSDENLQAHDDVLRRVMEHGEGRTVVPMQFGMAFANERTLKNVLRNARLPFTQALRNVEGAVELGLKVVADEGADVDEEVLDRAAEDLEALSESVVENGRFTDRLLLNRSYLVDRDRREAFAERVDELEESIEGARVQFTGPWAPYNFVDVHVGVEQ